MRTSIASLACGLILSLLHSGPLCAEQVAIDPQKDNTLFESNDGSLSNGIGQGLYSGRTNNDLLRRAVIAFDIAGNVPAGATITSVSLQLSVSIVRGGTHTSALHRLTSDWGEGNSNSTLRGGGQGAPAAANDATWLHSFFSDTNWTTEGGDFVATASASIQISGIGNVVWELAPKMVSDVQSWLDTPATNFGWIILTDELSTGSAKKFDSREHNTPADRPVLVVVYEGSPVEASTWSTTKALYR